MLPRLTYAQNGEDVIILDYFKGFTGRLLDIGANDGITFSNSRLLIENGWKANLIEPSDSAFTKLCELYAENSKVNLHSVAIGDRDGFTDFYESGAHLPDGSDIALLSGVEIQQKWKHLDYVKQDVVMITYKNFAGSTKFDFITIDAEGFDWLILKQIDLRWTQCLCIEYNSIPSLAAQFTNYCAKFGMKEIHRNAENLIFAR